MMTKGVHNAIINVGLCLLIVCFLLVGCTEKENNITAEQHGISQTSDSLPNTDEYNDSVVGENLLLNNSVEEWDVEICEHPMLWLLPHGYCNKVTRNQNIVFNGRYSAKMKALESGVTARVSQLVRISPGSKIRIRFKYYVEEWKTNGARTYCYFRTGAAISTSISMTELRSFYSSDDYYIFRGGGRGIKFLPHILGRWQTFDEVLDVPPNANYFEFGINSYLGTVLYVDDCYVVEIKE